ncbi:esterase E4-like isoform X2 [Lycorma delicatula]|uniref:esterase E4-like isoform X2 n=1 Tax=Lycorma delicatula TaxID=130591 RepID=UPI003F518D81
MYSSKCSSNSSSLKVIILSLLSLKIVIAEIISTPQGDIQGIIKKTVNDNEIQAFLGIPFARPPIGDLRFKSPVPFGKWNGVWNASKDGNECVQKSLENLVDSLKQTQLKVDESYPSDQTPTSIIGSEDCLYLNVFTPDTSVPKKYPVMFYVHGGGFFVGSSNSVMYGPDLLLDNKDIILVASNYRIGPLGFASTEDVVMSGNYGMKDLVLALKWVQQNIASYGGNPESVTIFGGSAGGACVHYLTLSPLAKGLFHRAIPMSGTAHCPWSTFIPGAVANNTKKLASFVNCPTEPSNLLVECLRKVSADKLTQAIDKFEIWRMIPMVSLVPVVEPKEVKDAFMTESPLTVKSSIPMMIGVTKDEGVGMVAVLGIKEKMVELNARLNELLPVALFYDKSTNNPDELTNKIRKFYFGDINKLITIENIKPFMDMYGDSLFLQCASSAVENHEGTAYFYMFAHKGNGTIADILSGGFSSLGVSHAEDHSFLFSFQFPPIIEKKMLEGNDKRMSEEMVSMWTNFAKYGNPTPNSKDNRWDQLSIEHMNYYHIEYSKTRMENGLYKERNNFWKNLGWRDKITSKNVLVKTEL